MGRLLAIAAAAAALCCARKPEVALVPAGPLVVSDPPAAEIRLDGTPLGRQTPARIETWEPAVPHEIELELAGRVPARLEIAAGAPPPELHAQLVPAGYVDISSDPPGAVVALAGASVSRAPVKLPVPAGEKQSLALSLEGYVTEVAAVSVAAGESWPWHMKLRTAGNVDVQSSPLGAAVELDGAAVGKTPLQLAVEAGVQHRVKLSMAGLRPCERTFRVEARAAAPVACDLEDDDALHFRLRLEKSLARLQSAQKRLERLEKPPPNRTFSQMRADNALHSRLEDQLGALQDTVDEQQGELDSHRTELEERFEARGKPR